MDNRCLVSAAATGAVVPSASHLFGDLDVVSGAAVASSAAWIFAAARRDIIGRALPGLHLASGLLPVLMAAAVHVLRGSMTAPGHASIGAAVMSVPLLACHLVDPRALGFGDVKAAAVIGAALGLVVSPLSVATALVVAVMAFVATAALRSRSAMSFGPFLLAGAVVAGIGSMLVSRGLR